MRDPEQAGRLLIRPLREGAAIVIWGVLNA